MIKVKVGKLKLTKFSISEAASFPGSMDIVFYKDIKNGLYRLRYADNLKRYPDPIESLHRAMCVSKYAPEVIEGEVIGENSDEVRIIAESDLYILQKNAEKFEFLDITTKNIRRGAE